MEQSIAAFIEAIFSGFLERFLIKMFFELFGRFQSSFKNNMLWK